MVSTPLEKSLLQVLIAAACIEDSVLKGHFETLKKSFPTENLTLSEAFQNINSTLRKCTL